MNMLSNKLRHILALWSKLTRFLAKAIPFDLKLLEKIYVKELRPVLGIPEREDLTLKLWMEMIEEERNKK